MSDPEKKTEEDRNKKPERNVKQPGQTSQASAEKTKGADTPETTSLPANDEKEQLPPPLADNESATSFHSIKELDTEQKVVDSSTPRSSGSRNSGDKGKSRKGSIFRSRKTKEGTDEEPPSGANKESTLDSDDKGKSKEGSGRRASVFRKSKVGIDEKRPSGANKESTLDSDDERKPREGSELRSSVPRKSKEGIDEKEPSEANKESPPQSNDNSSPLTKNRESNDSSEWSFKSARDSLEVAKDHIKCPVIQEYNDIIETIKRQNSNLEKIRRDILCTSDSSERESLEKLYCIEEEKLNDELVKAMALQVKCPYERWPEIPVATNIFDEFCCVDTDHFVNTARRRLSVLERSSKKTAVEEQKENDQNIANDENKASKKLCRIPSKMPSICDTGELFKNLLDKVDKMENVPFGPDLRCFNDGDLNDLIVYLVKKRRKHLKNCQQCGPSSNCPKFVSICDELIWVCNLKLKQLTPDESASGSGKTEDLPMRCKSSPNSSQFEDKLSYKGCNANCNPNLPILNKKQENGKFSCENEQLSTVCPMKKQIYSSSCENFKVPPKCLMKQQPTKCPMKQQPPKCVMKQQPPMCVMKQQPPMCVMKQQPPNCPMKQQPPECVMQEYRTSCDVNCQQPTTVPKMQQCGTCGCRTGQMLSLFETMAADLKQLKGNYSSKDCVSEADAGLVYETQQLKQQIEELKKEKEEFKLILKEQETQMEDYRQRYLKAKQNVEEQCTKIKQLEKSNDNIEEQINSEMEKIKSKYDQRVKELPKLLEAESNKLKNCCKENEELKEKLTVVCTELHKLKEQNKKSASAGSEGQRLEIAKLKADLKAAREDCKKSEDTCSMQKGQIKCLKNELTALRQETTSIIARTKERVEREKTCASKKIHELEDDLAKARANTCSAKLEKEATMKQLNNVVCNCHNSQAKVRTLQIYIKSLLEQLSGYNNQRKSCCHRDHM